MTVMKRQSVADMNVPKATFPLQAPQFKIHLLRVVGLFLTLALYFLKIYYLKMVL